MYKDEEYCKKDTASEETEALCRGGKIIQSFPCLDQKSTTTEGYPPLHILLEKMEPTKTIFEFYHKRGADFNFSTEDGSVFRIAVKNRRSVECLKLLIKYGADWEREEKDGRSIIHSAVLAGNLNVVKFLVITLKIDVNVIDSSGYTPLELALNQGNVGKLHKIILFLVDVGADPVRMKYVPKEKRILEESIYYQDDFDTPITEDGLNEIPFHPYGLPQVCHNAKHTKQHVLDLFRFVKFSFMYIIKAILIPFGTIR